MKGRITFALLFVASGILIGCQGADGAAAANQPAPTVQEQSLTTNTPSGGPGAGAGAGAMTVGPPKDGPAPDMNEVVGKSLKKGN